MLKQYVVINGDLRIRKEKENIFLIHNKKIKKDIIANNSLVLFLSECNNNKTLEEIVISISSKTKTPKKEVYKKIMKIIEDLEKDNFLYLSRYPKKSKIQIREKCYKFPLNMVYIEPTLRCNLNCFHCYADSSSVSKQKELDLQDWFRIIDNLDRLGVMSITITGGEPFYRKDISEIIKYIHSRNLEYGVITNGVLLNKKLIDGLKETGPKFIAISLDSHIKKIYEKIRGSGNFQKVIKNIETLLQENINVQLNYILFKNLNDSYDHIVNYLKFAKNIRVRGENIAIDEFVPEGRGKNLKELVVNREKVMVNIKRAFQEIYGIDYMIIKNNTNFPKDSYCGIGRSSLYIKSDGRVVLCPVLSSNEFIQGNLIDTDLLEIWKNGEGFKKFRTDSYIGEECLNCNHFEECMGGCKAKAYSWFGKLDKKDPWMCAYFKNES